MIFSETKDMKRNNFASDDEYHKYLEIQKRKRKRRGSQYRDSDDESSSYTSSNSSSINYYDYNSASGLPMSGGGIDVGGNPFGTS